MELTTARAIAMLALGLGSFISGMTPACISNSARQKHPLLVSCLLCFGGGVLLATSLVHMLPEARVKLPDYTEVLLCVGFFIVYFVDELVHLFHGVNDIGRNRETYGSVEETDLLVRDGERDRCLGEVESPRICNVNHTTPCNRSSSGIIGLLCALLVHSLLEGLAIGLQESAVQVLILLGAVASHKYVVGFCLGAELCASFPGSLCSLITCVTLFSGGSVVGIAVGTGLESVGSLRNSTAIPVMQALAAGTLLYVTVSEVLPRERSRWHERKPSAGMAQFFSVAVGFVLMYLCTKYLDYDGE